MGSSVRNLGHCDLAMTPRGAIAGHGGQLKLIFRAANRKLLGVHCRGATLTAIASDARKDNVLDGSIPLQSVHRLSPVFMRREVTLSVAAKHAASRYPSPDTSRRFAAHYGYRRLPLTCASHWIKPPDMPGTGKSHRKGNECCLPPEMGNRRTSNA
jgi:hypothetical protein